MLMMIMIIVILRKILIQKNDEPPKKKIKTIDEQKCPGCYPIFQCNQTAHYGINGCIGYTEY